MRKVLQPSTNVLLIIKIKERILSESVRCERKVRATRLFIERDGDWGIV